MVPGSCLVSMFVVVLDIRRAFFKKFLSRKAINSCTEVLVKRSNGLEGILVQMRRKVGIMCEMVEVVEGKGADL